MTKPLSDTTITLVKAREILEKHKGASSVVADASDAEEGATSPNETQSLFRVVK